MRTSRRDFMKVFGVGLAALMLTRCKWGEKSTPTVTCYEAVIPDYATPTSRPAALDARRRLRLCWLSFGELAQRSMAQADGAGDSNSFGKQLTSDHRLALDELMANGEISSPVAGLVQEAYEAAVYHVWRSNAPITCYIAMPVDYKPESAAALVQQSEVLERISSQGSIDPLTLTKVRAALEHDMAYYALSEADIQSLYDRLVQEYQAKGQPVPSFDALRLEITPEARAAAWFLVDLLTENGAEP